MNLDNNTTTTSTAGRRAGATPPLAHRAFAAVAALGIGLATLTGCSASGGGAESSPSASQSASDAPLTLDNGWAKAADSGTTAAFGTLTNTSDKDVTVTGASADGTAGSVQLHETVTDSTSGSTTMRQKDGGFTIPAGKSTALEPGGNHIMLMDLTCSLKAGADLTLQLHSDAGTKTVTVPVRDYSGAKEEYTPGEDASGSSNSHEAMDMSSASPEASAGSSEYAEHSGHEHSSGGSTEGSGSSHAGMDMSSPSSSALPECHAG
ncbi:copper chaperone PCu(A)C [Kocuria salsicia]|uniref:copper chaperone PCu(A)C n=1 Tax=Kocuria salsicia TaxID=664639 RepID=UPI0011A8C5E7|nr:copper chaperone PCu(A)C [Kocuria salsicia]